MTKREGKLGLRKGVISVSTWRVGRVSRGLLRSLGQVLVRFECLVMVRDQFISLLAWRVWSVWRDLVVIWCSPWRVACVCFYPESVVITFFTCLSGFTLAGWPEFRGILLNLLSSPFFIGDQGEVLG